MNTPLYAIGDIHGQLGELHRVLDLIEADGGSDAQIVFLGDYTDRGPDSRGVIDALIAGRDAGRNWTFLKGNHDRMFNWFMQDYPKHDAHLPIEYYWLHPRLGGDTTLASYGVAFTDKDRQTAVQEMAKKEVPQAHLTFLNNLDLSFETEEYFFCHAGILPGVPLDQQSEHDLLWIRNEFHCSNAAHPKIIVHGHTPVAAPTHYGNRINLDAGGGNGKPLTAAVFEGRQAWVLTRNGRVALTPSV